MVMGVEGGVILEKLIPELILRNLFPLPPTYRLCPDRSKVLDSEANLPTSLNGGISPHSFLPPRMKLSPHQKTTITYYES